jgi:hypothetical protein
VNPTALRLLGVCLCLPILAGSASGQFVDVADSTLADTQASFGVGWGDYDGDGDQDLFLANATGENRLFRNFSPSGFVDVTAPALLGPGADVGVTWPDVDNDGKQDLFLVNAVSGNRLIMNGGGAGFAEVPGPGGSPGPAQSAAWADYDNDGDLDVFVTYWQANDKLWRNDGGVFTDVTTAALGDSSRSTGLAWADFDRDGDQDLYVGGWFGSRLYRNEGGGTFANVTTISVNKVGVAGVDWGDYNNDEKLDLYLCRDLVSNNLLRNDTVGGTVAFTDIFATAIKNSDPGQGTAFLDYDNDGLVDIFIANAGTDNSTGSPNALVHNDNYDFFTRMYPAPVTVVNNSRGAAVADYDGDGYDDVYVANWREPNQLLHNTMAGNGNSWLQVRLVGSTSNRFGVGARIRVRRAHFHYVREIKAGSSVYSSNALVAGFGLGLGIAKVDTVQVLWPSGVVSDSVNVNTNQMITIYEAGIPTGIEDSGTPVVRLLANAPNPFRSATVIRYAVESATAVDLRILDVAGRLVRTLEKGAVRPAGEYEVAWNGRGDDGRPQAGGIYFYTLEGRGFRESRRMILIR